MHLISYCLDFGFCFHYPRSYWLGYFDRLAEFGCDAVMLWVAGVLPTKGYEETLAWRCEYVPEIVDHLHSRGMKVYLNTGVFGWLGMSPGLIQMHPDIEITWPDSWKRKYPLDSTRRGICPTRGWNICLDYIESLYLACPRADGVWLENYCEKPHCQCDACREKGHWRIERDFLRAISERLWAVDDTTEIAWTLGYERTHGTYPESKIYDELRAFDDPRYIFWHVRMHQGYTDRDGVRHEWMNPEELSSFRSRVACLATNEEQFKVAHQAGVWGATMAGPAVRYLFLPEYDPKHFGYFVDAPPADPPLYDHVLFQLGWLRNQQMTQNPDWTPEDFKEHVRKRFFADADPAAEEYVEDILLLERLIVHDRICMFRSSAKLWGDIDGGETAQMKPIEPRQLERIQTIANRPAEGETLLSMKTMAQAIYALADRL